MDVLPNVKITRRFANYLLVNPKRLCHSDHDDQSVPLQGLRSAASVCLICCYLATDRHFCVPDCLPGAHPFCGRSWKSGLLRWFAWLRASILTRARWAWSAPFRVLPTC